MLLRLSPIAFIAGKVAASHPERLLSVVYGGQAPLIAGAKSSDSSEVEVLAKAVDEGKDLGAYIIAVTPPGKPKPTEAQQTRLLSSCMAARKTTASVLLTSVLAEHSGGKILVVSQDDRLTERQCGFGG